MATGDKLVNLDSLKTAYDTSAKFTAPMEASGTASAAHAAGEHFIYNGILYIATTDIASGATITPNTNCRAVPGGIGGEVSELKSALNSFVSDYEIEENINFSSASTIYGCISSTGNWDTNNTTSYIFNDSKVKRLQITAGENNAYFGLLANTTLVDGQPPTYATGIPERIRVLAGETVDITVPDDCVCIVVTKRNTNRNNSTPSSMKFVYYATPFINRTGLTSSDDLDNITAQGAYAWVSRSIPTNSPANGAGNLLVFTPETSLGFQRVIQYVTTSSSIFFRVRGSGEFNSWTELNPNYSNKSYVIAEANRVAGNVRAVQGGKTITMLSISDLHYRDDVAEIINAINDMSNAIDELQRQLHFDYDASYGDIIYAMAAVDGRTARTSYADGVIDYNGVTKLINAPFGNRKQLRLVGNHDMNALDSSGTKSFSMDMIYSYFGIYNEDLSRPATYRNRGYGYIDDEYRKLRIICLNTSDFGAGSPNKGSAGNLNYYMSAEQVAWLADSLDLTAKADAANWQIILMSHVPFDQSREGSGTQENWRGMIQRGYDQLLYAYENGTSATIGGSTFDFSGKNAAKLAVFIHGHTHSYTVDNQHYKSGTTYPRMKLARIAIPNALPGRDTGATAISEETGIDWGNGNTYPKLAGTAESTAFVVNTIDPENKIIYSHHYGAGLDRILHYDSQTVNGSTALTPLITPTDWTSMDTSIATVSSGTVTPVANGNVMVYAEAADGTREYFNLNVSM